MWLAQRLLALIPTLWLAVTLSFAALQLVPGDPAGALLAPNAPPDAVQAERHALGLDDPVGVRYARYLALLVRGDLGLSWASRRPVVQMVAEALPPTLALALAALAVALTMGVALGALAALYHGRALDRGVMALAVLSLSMPVTASGVLALALPAPWVTAVGGLLLPALVLGLGSAGVFARLVRAQLVEVLAADYVRTARAKGLPERSVVLRHALRNALLPVVTAAGLQFGFLLGGAVLTEMVFSRAGFGRLLLTAILQQDLPVVQGAVVCGALGYALANLAADAVQGWMDPRLR
jgi:peptide/nickel transport system permease protein/oligopeptide transport system permease protein